MKTLLLNKLSEKCGGEITGRDLRLALGWLLGLALIGAEIALGMLVVGALWAGTL